MYYIKLEVAMRIDLGARDEYEVNADGLSWVKRALNKHLKFPEEIVYIKHLEKYNEG